MLFNGERTIKNINLKKMASDLQIPDETQFNVFNQVYNMVKIISEHSGATNILEIGSGFSTVLLSILSEEKEVKIKSIDFSFKHFEKFYKHKEYKNLIDNIELIEGVSVSALETETFYRDFQRSEFQGIKLKDIISDSFFIKNLIDGRKLEYLTNKFDLNGLSDVKSNLSSDTEFFKHILDYYSNFGSFEKELNTLSNSKMVIDNNFLANSFDVIFFDSGELSSNVEFFKLNKCLKKGGLACFHDIYFPKSFKNWLPATLCQKNNDWKEIYIDQTTAQGMYIVQKLKD
jgi:predicted O-methyltransferase YrrM